MAKLKKRKDGRFVAVADGRFFYGKTAEEAEAKRDAYRRKTDRSLFSETVAEYARDWLPVHRHNVAPKTYELYQYFINIICDDIGEKHFPDVRPSDIKRIYSERFRKASESHIHHFRNIITAVFDAAVEDGFIAVNPARSKQATPHKGTAGTNRQITQEERQLILNTEHRIRPVAMTMLFAGLRDSEALALDVSRDVDFKNNIIKVRYFRHVHRNRVWIDTTGKSTAATRDIPLVPILAETLRNIPHLLAAGSDGKPLTTAGWTSAWSSYITALETAKNGVRRRWHGKRDIDKEHPPDPWSPVTFKPYSLRHSYCCMNRDAGVDPHVLQLWMGHSDISMIMKVYDHVSEDRVKNEAKKLIDSLSHSQPETENSPER